MGAGDTTLAAGCTEDIQLLEADGLAIDTALARVLRGGELSLAGDVDSNLVTIMRQVEFHGIAGLLGYFALDRLPHTLRDEIRLKAASQAFWEAQHVRRLRPVLEELEQRGARPLIFKGTALAYTHYDEPSMRRRGDTDILVRESSFEEACHIVRSFGFTAPVSGLTVRSLGARSFSITDQHGSTHEIDLHQRINSSSVIAKLFPHDELQGRSEPIPKIGEGARALGRPDALLVACFHRLIHSQSPYYIDGRSYLSPDRLIWLYDIKLLHEGLNRAEEQRTLELAEVKSFSAILADGLRAADQRLELDGNGLISRLGSSTPPELPYRYLYSGPVRRWMLDLAAEQRKGRVLIDVLVPPQEYMRVKYGEHRLPTLSLFYIWRALHGLYKAARRST